MNIETKYFTFRKWFTHGRMLPSGECTDFNMHHLFIQLFGKKLYIDWCYKKYD